jgi:hypothetical protein
MDQVVPLTNAPNATLAVDLSIDGGTVSLQLVVRFNKAANYWVMTVSDLQGDLVVDSVPLLTGVFPASNILGQQAYLGIGSAYVLNAGQVAQDSPDDVIGFGQNGPFLLLWSDTPTQ